MGDPTPPLTPPPSGPSHDPTVRELVSLSHGIRDAAAAQLLHVHLGWGLIVAILGVVLAALLLTERDAARQRPVIPPAVALRLDSLERSRAGTEARSAALQAAAAAAEERSAQLAERAAQAERAAAGLARAVERDRAAGPASASPSDSARYWHGLYAVRTEEADSLRGALARSDTMHAADSVALAAQSERATAAEQRAQALERVNAELADAARHAEPGCRILWSVPCPSRLTSYALGAASAVVVIAAVRR